MFLNYLKSSCYFLLHRLLQQTLSIMYWNKNNEKVTNRGGLFHFYHVFNPLPWFPISFEFILSLVQWKVSFKHIPQFRYNYFLPLVLGFTLLTSIYSLYHITVNHSHHVVHNISSTYKIINIKLTWTKLLLM